MTLKVAAPPADQADGSFVYNYERWFWMRNGKNQFLVRCPKRAMRKEPDFMADSWDEVLRRVEMMPE